MGWIESNRKSNKRLVKAIKDIRLHLGDTQEQFAARLDLSKRAIANYEKDKRPTATVMARLARAASDAGMGYQTNILMEELGDDLEFGEIKGGEISALLSNGRGYMRVQFEGLEAHAHARAFFDTFGGFQSRDPKAEAQAQKLLRNFTTEAMKIWRNK